ncbi:RING-H2 finger protein ATL74-like [Phragmites australis]|uniref:RING-H2 finger protein ATL74-like n=1 Tax=Phragmites australis TaxID=29695 RepID=UPI002D799BA0|nr:RING-H2 finger protein ATL74-like [Phragmites australis]
MTGKERDTVVLVCLACASCLIVATRAFANGYAAASSAGAVANGSGRRGLAPSALAAIPKLTYRRGCVAAAVVGWAQCAICLAVVRDGEVVRLLSACGYLFHVECIDLWLRSHATCPQCRRDDGEAATEKV